MDQGASGTCHAHSAAGALWTAVHAAGKSLFVPSPRLIASCTYADVRAAANPTGGLPELFDTGADLSDDSSALARWGVGPIQAPTSDGRFSDVESDPSTNVFPEPEIAALTVAGTTIVSGEYQIPVDAQAPTLCAQALDAGIPIWVGFFVDSAFEALGPSDIAQAPNQQDPNGGGHAVYISGYRSVYGAYQWVIENSWGTGWANGGAVWASDAWLESCWMLWPFPAVIA